MRLHRPQHRAAVAPARPGKRVLRDIDVELVDVARQRLAEIGYRPTLAEADDVRQVTEPGPTRLWPEVEDAYQRWTALGEPDWRQPRMRRYVVLTE